MKRKRISILLIVLLVILVAVFEFFAQSPILFFLNRGDVSLFKKKYPDSYVTGDLRISAIAAEIAFPPGSQTLLNAVLYLSYVPFGNKLWVHLDKYIGTEPPNEMSGGFPVIDYEIIHSVELRGPEKDDFLVNETRPNYFEEYFLRRNIPPKGEVERIKDVVLEHFENTIPGSKVHQVNVAPCPSGSFDPDSNGVRVLSDKVYDITVAYERDGKPHTITTQYGTNNDHLLWHFPTKNTLEKAEGGS